jgi:hypothetical protein
MNIKNKGITQTIVQNKVNELAWDAQYDGNVANILINSNNNGHKENYQVQLDNIDLANLLNIPSVDNLIDKRLMNDYRRNTRKRLYKNNVNIWKLKELRSPLVISRKSKKISNKPNKPKKMYIYI